MAAWALTPETGTLMGPAGPWDPDNYSLTLALYPMGSFLNRPPGLNNEETALLEVVASEAPAAEVRRCVSRMAAGAGIGKGARARISSWRCRSGNKSCPHHSIP